MRINLNTKYKEKDLVRSLGAQWDIARKTWFIVDVKDLTPFMQWITNPTLLAPVVAPVKQKQNRLPCPTQKIIELFNATLPLMPQVKVVTFTRRRVLATRWAECSKADKYVDEADGLQCFKDFFERIEKSNFLNGKAPATAGHKIFRANFDWIINATNFVKISEGNYDNERR